jgi:putative ABC transport system permease protein
MSLFQDLRFAVRLTVKDKWFSTVAVVALALGIGVNATVFTLVNAVLIRGLPFRDSGRLYMLSSRDARGGGNPSISYPDFQDLRSQTRAFIGLGAFSPTPFNIADERGMPEQVRGAWVSANAFSLLGQQPLLGRDFAPEEDRKGAEMVVILGYSIWKNRYGSDPNILGRPMRINGTPATIVGVMPDGMKFPSSQDMWVPLIPTQDQERRTARFLGVFGRLRDGASREEAQTEMNGIAGRLASQYPETNKDFPKVEVQTFNERFNGGQIRTVFLALMGAVGFVLLIACANVANLLLSRSAHRAREIAVRVAMGATRWRVVRQLLVESVVLGTIGGVIGLLLALVGVRLFDAAVSETGKPYWIIFTVDYVVIGFLAAICVLTGILFGFAPALQISRTNVNEVLKESGRGTAGGRRARWLSGTMVVVELALTIVLLVGAGLMIRSFLKLYTLDIGIQTDHLMSMSMRLPETKYKTQEERRVFYDRLVPKLSAVPGADAVALTTSVPPFGGGRREFEIEGRPARKTDEKPPQVTSVTVSPSFFDVVRVQLRRGRQFNEKDGSPGSETVIVNDQFVKQFFSGEEPLGKRVRFVQTQQARSQQPSQPPPVWRTIVGVSPSIRHNQPQEAEPAAVMYLPHRQEAPLGTTLFIRSHLEPGTIMSAVRREVQNLDQDQPVFTVQTMEQMLAQTRWPFRVFGSLFAILALIGLTLSSVGLYAVMAYSVTQRTQEIGVRMALGAAGRQVRWLILRRGLIQLSIGLTLGLVGAFFISKVIQGLLVQVTPTDPATFAIISTLLVLVAIAACLIPAARATRVDPLVALRNE